MYLKPFNQTAREHYCAQFILMAQPHKEYTQISLIDTSDSNPLMWSLPMSNEDAQELEEAFDKYGYTAKFKELIGEF
jgi:hypothetical protein